MKLKLALIIGLMIAASACSTIKTTEHNTVDNRVNNIVWQVASFKGRPLNAADFTGGIPTLTFSMSDGKISGNDGCNSLMGLATYKSDRIKTGAIATTKMACGDAAFQTDFYEILGSPNLTWRMGNDEILRLYVNDAEVMALKEKM